MSLGIYHIDNLSASKKTGIDIDAVKDIDEQVDAELESIIAKQFADQYIVTSNRALKGGNHSFCTFTIKKR